MYLIHLEPIAPVYQIGNFLTDDEISKIFKYSEKLLYKKAIIGNKSKNEEKKLFTPSSHIKDVNTGNVPRKRITNVKWIELNDETNWLYKKIIQQIHKVNQENFNLILRHIEVLQFSEYTDIQNSFYARHTDCGNKSDLMNFVDIRKLSFSIQLTDENDYEGGELVLYNGDGERKIVAQKPKGTIIFFNSDIAHEVKPIKKGTRHALVGWVLGPNLR